MMDLKLDNICYYYYKEKIFVNKKDAFEEALRNRDYFPDIFLWYHDDIFSQINWAIEPSQTLDQLYKQRAQQIRDSYDYVVLFYSGGADSHQILETFLDNNLFVDEIRVHYPFKLLNTLVPTYDVNHRHGLIFEFELTTLPRLRRIAELTPKTKITLVDMTDELKEEYSTEKTLEKYTGTLLTSQFYHSFRLMQQINSLERDISRVGFSKQKVGAIYGSDKPSLSIQDQQLLFAFSDMGLTGPGICNFKKSHDEVLFYWTPDAPLIPIKQSHIIKRALEQSQKAYNLARENYPKNLKESNLVKRLIYPTFNSQLYQKAVKAHDDGIIEDFLTINESLIKQGNYFNNKYKHIRTTGKAPDGRTVIRSRFYNLGRLNLQH